MENGNNNLKNEPIPNIGLQHAVALLNPPSGEPWRTTTDDFAYLTERDRPVFHIENQPFGVRISVDTRVERGKEIARTFLVPVYQPFLAKWIADQTAYITSLPPRPAFVLRAYSRHGDVLVNRYLRKQRTDVGGLIDASIEAHSIPFQYQIYDNYDILQKRYKARMPPKKDLKRMDPESYVSLVDDNRAIFKTDDVILLLMKGFFQDLMRIFLKAPRLPHSVLTYRGLKSETHVKELRFRTPDFQSTSINPYSANLFAEQLDYVADGKVLRRRTPKASLRRHGHMRCCMYEIRVEPSVPCLYMESGSYFHGEYELLLPPGIDMELSNTIQVRTIVYPPRRPSANSNTNNSSINLSFGNNNNYDNNDNRNNSDNSNKTAYPHQDPGIVELYKKMDNVLFLNDIEGNISKAVYRPPTRFGAPLTPDEKEALFEGFLESYYDSTVRIAVVPAHATSVYFSPKKKVRGPVINNTRTRRASVPSSSRRPAKTARRIRQERHKAAATRRRVRAPRPPSSSSNVSSTRRGRPSGAEENVSSLPSSFSFSNNNLNNNLGYNTNTNTNA